MSQPSRPRHGGVADKLKQLLAWQSQHEGDAAGVPEATLTIPHHGPIARESPVKSGLAAEVRVNSENRVETIETVRKWGLRYDGGKDLLGYLERLEELVSLYEIETTRILRAMSELLRDNNKQWSRWEAFRHDFGVFLLRPQYFEKLEDEIRKRTQRHANPSATMSSACRS